MNRQTLAGIVFSLVCTGALAQVPSNTVKLGVLSDFTGIYSAWGGKGSMVATEMAIEDFKKANPGFPYKVEVVQGDFQLKPDLAVAITKKWMDEGVNAILDVPMSAAALAVSSQVKGSKVASLMNGSASNDFAQKACSANVVHWTYDAHSIGSQTVKANLERGGKNWFFITQDSLGGAALENGARPFIDTAGGKVVGVTKNPTGQADFSSQLVQAQASKADVIAVAQGGTDTTNVLKQAREFGVSRNQKLAILWALLPDIKGMGLDAAQDLVLTEAFYWDANEATRSFAHRFMQRYEGKAPSAVQAGAYSVVTHYLKAVAAAKSTDAPVVIQEMKKLPVQDVIFGKGTVRQDGRMVHDLVLVQVKKPAESKGPWDLYKVLKTVPGEEAFRPMSKDCTLVQ